MLKHDFSLSILMNHFQRNNTLTLNDQYYFAFFSPNNKHPITKIENCYTKNIYCCHYYSQKNKILHTLHKMLIIPTLYYKTLYLYRYMFTIFTTFCSIQNIYTLNSALQCFSILFKLRLQLVK